jgi:predicted ATPase with chaperone activity
MTPADATAEVAAAAPPAAQSAPPIPQTLADTGLSEEFLTELILKTLYVQGARTGQQLTDAICLPFPLADDLLMTMQQRMMVEVQGTKGHGRAGYVFDLGGEGRDRAREAMASSQYVGPAPVPLAQYRRWVDIQSIRHARANKEALHQAFSWLVLDPEMVDMVGPAVNSAKSLFLFGDSGNGKTAIAETIARMLGGEIFVPHAVEIDGQVMLVLDPIYHRVAGPADGVEEQPGIEMLWRSDAVEFDSRFVKVRRPVVLTGGELTLEQLDLQYDEHTKFYQAPFQTKATGGVLIVDDFGRQRVPPRDLLNRWIVPLEKNVDFLTLHTGGKFPVPFDCLLIFATNLDPQSLVEEAFLRRIHYKIEVGSPTPRQYQLIFRRCCEAKDISFKPEAIEYIYHEYYGKHSIEPRGCHPRDLVDHLSDIARYLEVEGTLSTELVDYACRSYFLADFPTASA